MRLCRKHVGTDWLGQRIKPHVSLCEGGEVKLGDLPLTFVEATHGKLEQFCDVAPPDRKWDS